jgi:hypothetical protein
MPESAPSSAALPPRRPRGPWARMRLPVLLITVLVGALGAFRIWQIMAPFSFEVEVEGDPDLTGQGSALLVDSNELLEDMEYALRLQKTGELVTPQPLPPARARTAKLTVKGSQRRGEIEAERVVGVLRYPGSDPDRLTLELSKATFERGKLRQVLLNDRASEFLSQKVTTFVAVKNQHDDPVEGLHGALEPGVTAKEGEPAVYVVPIQIDDLLFRMKRGEQEYHLELVRSFDALRGSVDFPLRWFVSTGTDPHVRQVQEKVETFQPPPQPKAVEPARVVASAGWDGRLRVSGSHLDRAIAASLEHGRESVSCKIVSKSADALELSVAAGLVSAGAWNLVVTGSAGGEVSRLAGALKVEGGLWWESPGAGQQVPAGDMLEVRWGTAGVDGNMLIEGAPDAGSATWTRVFSGGASTGGARWSTAGLSPGPFVLRLTAVGRADLQPLLRRIEIVGPKLVQAVLRFRKGGHPYGNVRELVVDDKDSYSPGPDPMIWKVRLTPGRHTIRAKGGLLAPKLIPLEVQTDGEEIEVDLGS